MHHYSKPSATMVNDNLRQSLSTCLPLAQQDDYLGHLFMTAELASLQISMINPRRFFAEVHMCGVGNFVMDAL